MDMNLIKECKENIEHMRKRYFEIIANAGLCKASLKQALKIEQQEKLLEKYIAEHQPKEVI